MIEAYCDRRSAGPGERVGLHISGDTGTLDIAITREGAVRTPVWSAEAVAIEPRPVPDDAVEHGCRWPRTLEIPVTPDWPSGFYLITLRAGEDIAHAGFVVRPHGTRAPILMVLSTNTWNAYNDFGGANTYTAGDGAYAGGAPRVSFLRPWPRGFLWKPEPPARLASTMPGDEVLGYFGYAQSMGFSVWSGSAGWCNWEAPFHAWLEAAGHHVDMATNEDLEKDPDLLDGVRLYLSVGHDEYWTWGMRDAVEGFVARGGNAAFFSGNTAFWQVRLEDGGDTMVAWKTRYRDDPVVGTAQECTVTGLWSNRYTGRPENTMTGVSFCRGGYARIGGGTPRGPGGHLIDRPEHWVFEGTGLRYGDVLGGDAVIVGYECDGCDFTLRDGRPYPTGLDGTPADFTILGHAPAQLWSKETAPPGLYPEGTLSDVELVAEQITGRTDPAAVARFFHGNAVMGVHQPGGTVFTAGTTDWAYGIRAGDPLVERVTANVITRLSGG